jgi:hypothetical protein
MRHSNFYQRIFKPTLRETLPEYLHAVRFHDLRHSNAALLIAEGGHPKAIQQRLGHSASPSRSIGTATCSRRWTTRSRTRSTRRTGQPKDGRRSLSGPADDALRTTLWSICGPPTDRT